MTRVRREKEADYGAVRQVVEAAFGQPHEAALVDALRAQVPEAISLVAEDAGAIVGHVLFTPVELEPKSAHAPVAGLAPLAVLPARQRSGIGSALVREGLRACEAHGYGAVVVLGHPEYYARFGFVPAHTLGLRCEFPAPPEVYRVFELAPVLSGEAALVKYPRAFHEMG